MGVRSTVKAIVLHERKRLLNRCYEQTMEPTIRCPAARSARGSDGRALNESVWRDGISANGALCRAAGVNQPRPVHLGALWIRA
jgi:hypothetical protein